MIDSFMVLALHSITRVLTHMNENEHIQIDGAAGDEVVLRVDYRAAEALDNAMRELINRLEDGEPAGDVDEFHEELETDKEIREVIQEVSRVAYERRNQEPNPVLGR